LTRNFDLISLGFPWIPSSESSVFNELLSSPATKNNVMPYFSAKPGLRPLRIVGL